MLEACIFGSHWHTNAAFCGHTNLLFHYSGLEVKICDCVNEVTYVSHGKKGRRKWDSKCSLPSGLLMLQDLIQDNWIAALINLTRSYRYFRTLPTMIVRCELVIFRSGFITQVLDAQVFSDYFSRLTALHIVSGPFPVPVCIQGQCHSADMGSVLLTVSLCQFSSVIENTG